MVMDSPTEAEVRESKAGEQIALNLEPESGLYKRGVAVLDFTSLYPTVIIAQNMCYTTIVGNYKDHQDEEPQNVGTKMNWTMAHWELPDEDEIHSTSTNCAFVNKEKRLGIMPQVQTQEKFTNCNNLISLAINLFCRFINIYKAFVKTTGDQKAHEDRRALIKRP